MLQKKFYKTKPGTSLFLKRSCKNKIPTKLQRTLHSCQNKNLFWTNDHLRSISQWQPGDGAHASSGLWICVRPRIVSESVNASEILTQTGTWNALLVLLLRCNGMWWQGWPFPVGMQIWIGSEISLSTLYGACVCTWKDGSFTTGKLWLHFGFSLQH